MVRRSKKLLLITIISVFMLPTENYSQSFFQRGEDLLMKNQLEEARAMFEAALSEEPSNEKIYLYLGYIYEQQKRYDRAIAVLQRGLSAAKIYADSFYFNLGNNFFAQEKNTMAQEMYTKALEKNPTLSSAYLNRANASLKLEEYEKAVSDYRVYLQLDPATIQRPSIERVIAILTNIAEEREKARATEAARIAEEEQRRKALLGEVLSSLQHASEGTLGISAGSETLERIDEEFDIAD